MSSFETVSLTPTRKRVLKLDTHAASASMAASLTDTDPKEGTETALGLVGACLARRLTDTDPKEGTETWSPRLPAARPRPVSLTPTRKRVLKHLHSPGHPARHNVSLTPTRKRVLKPVCHSVVVLIKSCLTDTDPKEGTETFQDFPCVEVAALSH